MRLVHVYVCAFGVWRLCCISGWVFIYVLVIGRHSPSGIINTWMHTTHRKTIAHTGAVLIARRGVILYIEAEI